VYWSRSSVGGEHQAQAMGASDAARDLFRRAAMSGYSLAQLNLTAAFDHSRLMPHNPLRAYIWYSIAAVWSRIRLYATRQQRVASDLRKESLSPISKRHASSRDPGPQEARTPTKEWRRRGE
jgi:hypothetical protein